MRLKRLLISAVAVLGLSALGSSANAAALTASGAGHDQIAGKGKSTFTLIFRGGAVSVAAVSITAVSAGVGSAVAPSVIAVALAAATPLRAGQAFMVEFGALIGAADALGVAQAGVAPAGTVA